MSILIALFIARSAIPLIQASFWQWNKSLVPQEQNLQMPEIGRINLKDLIVSESE
ncbi:MAG: hypothetical protein ACFB2X_04220 [Rivularia sp. (in: cyanobacteria)]